MFPADAGKRWVLNGDPGFGGEFISDRLDWREQARGRASRLWTAFRVLAPMTSAPRELLNFFCASLRLPRRVRQSSPARAC